MTVRFASFNVENLFARPRAFNQTTWAQGQPILDAYAEFNALIAQPAYSPADKARMISCSSSSRCTGATSGMVHRNRTPTPKWAWLRANRGSLRRRAHRHRDRDRRRRPGCLDRLAGAGHRAGRRDRHPHDRPGHPRCRRRHPGRRRGRGPTVAGPLQHRTAGRPVRPCHADRRQRHPRHRRRHHDQRPGRDRRRCAATSTSPTRARRRAPVQPRLRPVPVPAAQRRDRVGARQPLQEPVRRWRRPNAPAKPQGSAPSSTTLVAAGERNIVVSATSTKARPSWASRPPTWPPLVDPNGPLVEVYALASLRPGAAARHLPELRDPQPPRLHPGLPRPGRAGGRRRHRTTRAVGDADQRQPARPSGTSIPQITGAHQAASDHAAIYVDINI